MDINGGERARLVLHVPITTRGVLCLASWWMLSATRLVRVAANGNVCIGELMEMKQNNKHCCCEADDAGGTRGFGMDAICVGSLDSGYSAD